MAGANAEQQPNAQQQQPQGEVPKDAPPPKTYSQEEVDRIADKVRRNARRDAELRVRREQQAEPQQQPEKKDEPKEETAPKREDFDTYEDFIRADAAFTAKKATREESAKAKEEEKARQAREAQEKAAQTWHGKIEAAQKKLPDFQDVLEDHEDVLDIVYNSRMREAITESDIGPEIVYELCKNAGEAKRIAALPGYKQAAEIAKIEERLLAAGKKPAEDKGDEEEADAGAETPEEKKAREDRERDAGGRFQKKDPPAPIEPGSGRPATSSSQPSDKDDPETWRRKRVAALAKRRG